MNGEQKSVSQIIQQYAQNNINDKIKKCCEKHINKILQKEELTNEDIQNLNALYDLYNKCCCKKEEKEVNYPYSNTKEDFEALKSAYLGNRTYENDFIMNLLLKIKMLDTILNK